MSYGSRTRSREPASGLNLGTELLRLVDRVSRIETTADHARAIWRQVEDRFAIGDGRMDRTDLAMAKLEGSLKEAVAELKGLISEIRALVQSRDTEERRRMAFRGDALKGAVLLLALATGVGALLGKVPWSTFDIFAGGLVK